MLTMTRFLTRYRDVIYYGIAMSVLAFGLHWLELRLLIIGHSFEIYAGIIAVIFTALGIWIALQLAKPKTKTVIVEKIADPKPEFTIDRAACERLNISKRELEVLQLIALGHSNAEIAATLFVSVNTVKTHIGKLFEKLGANRRIQAIEKAKQIGLLP